MRPKVRHIAVMTKNREKMVEFYQKIFGLEPKRGFSSEFNDAVAECINGPAIH